MDDKINYPTGDIGSGSVLMLADTVALGSGEVRTSAAITTRAVSTVGIDIRADKNCTVKIVRLPDGEIAGAESIIGSVVAGTPSFFSYSNLLCPAIKVVVENTGGSAMSSFAMYVRGGR